MSKLVLFAMTVWLYIGVLRSLGGRRHLCRVEQSPWIVVRSLLEEKCLSWGRRVYLPHGKCWFATAGYWSQCQISSYQISPGHGYLYDREIKQTSMIMMLNVSSVRRNVKHGHSTATARPQHGHSTATRQFSEIVNSEKKASAVLLWPILAGQYVKNAQWWTSQIYGGQVDNGGQVKYTHRPYKTLFRCFISSSRNFATTKELGKS